MDTTQSSIEQSDLFRVLIVDDEPAICEILAEMLAAPDRQIEVRHDAKSALELVSDHAIDLAFLDVNLPGLSGVDLADRIKQKHPRAHIIICSGYVGPELAIQSGDGRIDKVLQKPVDYGEVVELVNSYTTD